ncbi:hypothetical protein NC652_007759 [Populus alba x Populus x berolinensis]|uniref:Uncharacterized protein n=1 Tax=Populus alba x Populus x berolinensis TaxID=444605 RepID=A0AAD6Q6A6_9ROSI|nr:hypothetical protein NC652_007759 [Populus alba x Populus x berolinensis]KAJ6980631.1 hypothetical protein NC653_028441 [Populus alba x Populus x berolinensis]
MRYCHAPGTSSPPQDFADAKQPPTVFHLRCMFRPPNTCNTLCQGLWHSASIIVNHPSSQCIEIATRTASKTAHKIIFVDDFGFSFKPTESATESVTSTILPPIQLPT